MVKKDYKCISLLLVLALVFLVGCSNDQNGLKETNQNLGLKVNLVKDEFLQQDLQGVDLTNFKVKLVDVDKNEVIKEKY